MIEDCKAGKIDLIMTKSIARFARNIVDCLSVIDLLKNLEPPVGVQFEADNIYTLDNNGRMILTILASVAEEESHSKSVIMNWSIERRFRKGLFLTPELLGYDRDEDGDLIVNEDEAETVKAIYYLYLNGVSFELTGLENPNSVSQLKTWLDERGISMDTLGKKNVTEMIGELDKNGVDAEAMDIDDYEKEYDRLEQENERLADHYRGILNDIREEVDALDTLLYDTRLNRARMRGAVKIIRQMIHREL